jgi:carbon-monoxide dehydrogenase medium subunit/2-furoyl-CoA dehydrogenase FAD binding subunit
MAREMAQAALKQTEPGSDLHANADYRRHLGVVMLTRVLLKAAQAQCASRELQH